MTIYDRIKKAVDSPTSDSHIFISRNDLSNMLEALQKCDDMICESCGCISYPQMLKNVMKRRIDTDNDDI